MLEQRTLLSITLISDDPNLANPGPLATDGAKLYVGDDGRGVADPDANRIFTVPIDGGPATLLYPAATPCCVSGLAAIGNNLFWIDPNGDPDATAIFRGSTSGGPVTKIYSGFATGQPIVDGIGITTDGLKLYTSDAVQGRVHSLNTDGGGITQLGSNRYGGFFDREHLNFIDQASGVLYVADEGRVEFPDTPPRVQAIPGTGGSFTDLYVGPAGTPRPWRGIAVGDGKVFLTEGSQILAMPTDGSSAPSVFVSDPRFKSLEDILFLSGALYVADSGNFLDATGAMVDGPGAIYQVTLDTCGTWSTLASMPTPRGAFDVGVIDGKIYAAGGISDAGAALPMLEVYDPATNTWTTNAPMSIARNGVAVGVVDGILYAIGGATAGVNGIPLNSVEAYDPATNTWTPRAPMPTSRAHLDVAVVDGILYAIGGADGSILNKVEAYDPKTNTWSIKPAIPTPRGSPGVEVLGGIIYVTGGQTGPGVFTGAVEAYDPATNTWTTKAPMPTGRGAHGVSVLNGRLYALGGNASVTSVQLNTVESYDPVTNSWRTEPAMPTGRDLLAASAVDGSLYAIGGRKPTGYLGTVEAFTPACAPATRTEIHGLKFHDLDGDGQRDNGESGLDGWTIELRDAAGNLVASTTTTSGDLNGDGAIDPETERGLYSFSNLAAGTYTVAEVPQPGWEQTFPEQSFSLAATQNTPFPAPTSIASGDFDHDGDLDLAIGTGYWPMLSVLLNNGDGTFAPGVDQNVYAGYLVAADVDGDGHLDLAAAPLGSPAERVFILFGNGDGTFAAPQEVLVGAAGSGGASNQPMALGDLDGDGNIDIAMVDRNSRTIAIMYNRGNRAFADRVDVPAGGDPLSVTAADLDGDGDTDLAVGILTNPDGTVAVLLNQGAETFAAPASYTVGGWPVSITAADLDGDGDLDLAGVTWTTDAVWTLVNDGSGTFTLGPTAVTGEGPHSLAAADLDGDSDLDLAVVHPAPAGDWSGAPTQVLSVLFNRGNAMFAPPVYYGTGDAPYSVAAGDLDGDGDLDLAVANNGGGFSVLRNEGRGTFPAARVFEAGMSFGPRTVAAGDLDADGLNDLAVAFHGCTGSADNVGILRNRGDKTFVPIGSYGGNDCPQSLVLGDLDRDGDLDLAMARWHQPAGSYVSVVSVLANQGDGTFATPVDYPVADGPDSMIVGDLDRDGDLDLAVTSTESQSVSVLLNQGDGTFTAAVNYASGVSGSGYTPLAAADLDGDGDVDLAAVFYSDIFIFLNNGDGTFAAPRSYPASTGDHLLAADLDGDGDVDLATYNSLLFNRGDGTFGEPVRISPGVANVFALADVDDDGDVDLIGPTSGSVSDANNWSVALNDGEGTFANPLLFSPGSWTSAAVASDLDGDGDLDLALATPGSIAVSVIWNTSTKRTYTVTLSAGQVVEGLDFGNAGTLTPQTGSIHGQKFHDLDGDGVRDLDEPGLDAVTIEVVDPATGQVVATQETHSMELDGVQGINPVTEQGLYWFTELSPGLYEVREQAVDGWVQSFPESGQSYIVALGAGERLGTSPVEVSFVAGPNWVDRLESGSDTLFLTVQVQLTLDAGEQQTAFLSGPMVIRRSDPQDTNGDSLRDTIDTEIVAMQLLGDVPGVGIVTVTLAPRPSTGQIRQSAGATDAESSFDVFVTVAAGQDVWQNDQPVHVSASTDHWPPIGAVYVLDTPVPILDDLGEVEAVVTAVTAIPTYGLDFGNFQPLPPTGSILGLVFIDQDADGQPDPVEEQQQAGVTVYLDANNNGQLDAGETSTVTGGSVIICIQVFGALCPNYEFTHLSPGTYTVREVVPDGFRQTAPPGGFFTATVEAGQTYEGEAFGNSPVPPTPGYIVGLKFEDLDSDGQLDTDEPGLNSVTIYLDANDNGQLDPGETAVVTAAADDFVCQAIGCPPGVPVSGAYYFAGLTPGAYVVREVVPDGYEQTAPAGGFDRVEVLPAEVALVQHFGNTAIEPENEPPQLDPIDDQGVDEGSLVEFIAVAIDPDAAPGSILHFSLDPGAPAGTAIDPETGEFTWTPTEEQGPGTYEVTVRVTDDGEPAMSDVWIVTITVNEVNVAPVLAPIGNKTVREGVLLTFTATATDSDVPGNTLHYSLDPAAPAGATIDPITGVFTWTPSLDQGPGTYEVTIRVADDGEPLAADNETVTITVLDRAPGYVMEVVTEGNGTVASTPRGIKCGADCTETYAPNQRVTLRARPARGLRFLGWDGGGCTGTGTCVATMNTDTRVTARFGTPRRFTLQVNKIGDGTVTSQPRGIKCGTDCSEDYLEGQQVRLKAKPLADPIFVGWNGGGCSGRDSCIVTMDQSKSVTASFARVGSSSAITISDATADEGDDGSTGFVFTVSLNDANRRAITVDFTTANGTAVSGSDYVAATGTLSFAPGDTSQTITISVLGDNLAEPNETFFVNLTNPRNATISDSQGTGTITNGDFAPEAPTGVVAIPGDGQVMLRWNPVPNTTSYNVYMASVPGVTKANYATLPDGMKHESVTSPFTHAGLRSDQTYYFVVTAINAHGESTESVEVAVNPCLPGSGDNGEINCTLETVAQLISSTQGGSVSLPETGAVVSIPPGTFEADEAVTVSSVAPSLAGRADYINSTLILDAGPAAPALLVVETGPAVPQSLLSLSIHVPDDFLALLGQQYGPALFVKGFWQNDLETKDGFDLVDSQFDPATQMLTGTIPDWGFTELRNGRGTFESIVAMGSLPLLALTPGGAGRASIGSAMALQSAPRTIAPPPIDENLCDNHPELQFYSPLSGLSPNQLQEKIKPEPDGGGFGVYRTKPVAEYHMGIDYSGRRGPDVATVVPAADGWVAEAGWSDTTGQTVIVQHEINGIQFRTSYQHLEAGSIHIADGVQGTDHDTAKVVSEYAQGPTAGPGRTYRYTVYGRGVIPVVGGVTPIGVMDNSGSATTFKHLHFEAAQNSWIRIPNRTIEGKRFDPTKCIMLSSPLRPAIALSTQSLSFLAIEEGPDPDSQSFTVTNSGPDGSFLNYTILVGPGDLASRITVSPPSGRLTSDFFNPHTVSVNSTDLKAGTFTGKIIVDDLYATNNQQSIDVTLAVAPSQTTISIDDAPPVIEGNTGETTTATFTVKLSEVSAKEVTFKYSTINGSAIAGDDFEAVTAMPASIPAGSLTTQVTVRINGDDQPEDDENFFVFLSDISNAKPGTTQGKGTILDDDLVTYVGTFRARATYGGWTTYCRWEHDLSGQLTLKLTGTGTPLDQYHGTFTVSMSDVLIQTVDEVTICSDFAPRPIVGIGTGNEVWGGIKGGVHARGGPEPAGNWVLNFEGTVQGPSLSGTIKLSDSSDLDEDIVMPLELTRSANLSGRGTTDKATTESMVAREHLGPIIGETNRRWAAGVGTQVLVTFTQFTQLRIEIVDLPGSLLGVATSNTVYVDRDAAGYGWFIDMTPESDEEFDHTSDGALRATGDGQASQRIDLLTVLMHEFGHVLGLEDLDADHHPHDLMSGTLEPGIRVLPSADLVDSVLQSGL